MKKLMIDTGVREYDVNGNGLLRFNPSDLNVYNRFMEMQEKIEAMDKELTEKAQSLNSKSEESIRGSEFLALMHEYDARTKALLSEVFGAENDFDKLLGGVNLMAVGENGQRIIENLVNALEPIIEAGLQRHMDEKADAAVKRAKANRAARRATNKK